MNDYIEVNDGKTPEQRFQDIAARKHEQMMTTIKGMAVVLGSVALFIHFALHAINSIQ